MRKYWTEEEENYLRDNYRLKSNTVIGEHLNRGRESVKGKCTSMGLIRTSEDISNIISQGMKMFFKKPNTTWERVRRGGVLYDKRTRRQGLLDNFGGKCVNCEENDYDVLQFDHIDNDGCKYQSVSILTQVEKNPEKFQILCANCNTKKEVYRREFKRLEKLEIPPF